MAPANEMWRNLSRSQRVKRIHDQFHTKFRHRFPDSWNELSVVDWSEVLPKFIPHSLSVKLVKLMLRVVEKGLPIRGEIAGYYTANGVLTVGRDLLARAIKAHTSALKELSGTFKYWSTCKSAGNVKVTRVPETRLQAPVTPSERHMNRNQKVPGRPSRTRPPWNLLVSLHVSLRESYGTQKASFWNTSYFVHNLPG
jgi:hypothetical protein